MNSCLPFEPEIKPEKTGQRTQKVAAWLMVNG
jgi:hypothetical protein